MTYAMAEAAWRRPPRSVSTSMVSKDDAVMTRRMTVLSEDQEWREGVDFGSASGWGLKPPSGCDSYDSLEQRTDLCPDTS